VFEFMRNGKMSPTYKLCSNKNWVMSDVICQIFELKQKCNQLCANTTNKMVTSWKLI